MSQSPTWKWAAVALLVAIAALIAANLRFAADDPGEALELRPGKVAAEIEDQDDDSVIDAQSVDPSATVRSESAPCLTLEQVESHPILVQDGYRYDAVSDSGPTIGSYRGLSERELQDLAAQGDSAAMAVLGAMSVMRARKWPEEKAVSYLMLEDPELMAFRFTRPFSPEFVNHMAQARQWFYKAALHGRVMVLHRVGDSLSFEQGGPVELGWVSQEEYDRLSSYEKSALIPSNVYAVLAYEIAPGLKTGLHGELFSGLMPHTEQQEVIVDQLADQFVRDLEDAALPPIVVPESSVPPLEDLLLLLCESERERLERNQL